MRWLAILVSAILFPTMTFAGKITVTKTIDENTLPKIKTIPSGNYLTSRQTYELLSSDPDILFIDVRDPMEISLAGRPKQVDAIVPVRVQSNKFDDSIDEFKLVDNPDFMSQMEKVLAMYGKSKHDMIIITCGSGMRSAKAAHVLIKSGYTNVWHIPDGYAGDEKPGMNSHNAWKLAGLPWTKEKKIFGNEWIKILE